MENPLGGQVAVDLHTSQLPPGRIEHRPCGPLEDARRWMHHLQFLAHASFDSARQFPPALREGRRFRGMTLETTDQSLQRLAFPGFLGSQTRDLRESRIHRADIVLGIEQDDSFFEPFDDVLQFDFRSVRLSCRFTGHQRFEQD